METDAGIDGPIEADVEQGEYGGAALGDGDVEGDEVGGVFDVAGQGSAAEPGEDVGELALAFGGEQSGVG